MGEKNDIKVEELDFTFNETTEEHEPVNLGSVEPLKEIVADAGSFKLNIKLTRRSRAKLRWFVAKIYFEAAFDYSWEAVKSLFRKG